jgi:tetratricopeptide (TPR) repeat protein
MPASLSQAVALHRKGQLDAADAAYRAILASDPKQADALHLRGVIALQTGRPGDAIPLILDAIALAPDRAPFHFNLASAFGQSGRPIDAVVSYDRALVLQPAYPEALTGQATALIALSRLADAGKALDAALYLRPGHADTLYRKASIALALGDHHGASAGFEAILVRQPDFAPAHAGRGLALAGLDRLADALACFDQALRHNPADPDTHANRALTLSKLGRPDEALAGFEIALRLNPAHIHALDNRGIVLRTLERFPEALASHDAALVLDSAFVPAHDNRGATLQAMHHYQDALAAHEHALALNPSLAAAHNNRATALQALERYDEALAGYDAAIALRPDDADAMGNRAVPLQMTGRAADAMAGYDAALAIRPNDIGLRFNASLCRLLLGDLEAGWRDFEFRWDSALMAPDRRDLGRPRWSGETTGTVLLHAEQGFGDTIQFCRYAPMVADRGVHVVLEVQQGLVRLMRRLDPRITVLARGATLPAFDWHCPLMSLPLALGTPIIAKPYLHADTDLTEEWRRRLSALPGRKVGLVWAGSPRRQTPVLTAADRRRSIAPRRLVPLASVPGITLVSLQKGEAAAGAQSSGLDLLDFTGELADFDDTAALVAELDLVISVDTAVAHLAGGLGVPVWVLNRFDTCWRWMLGRSDSPWYESATVFRQPAPGDWDSVVRAVAAELGGNNGQDNEAHRSWPPARTGTITAG